METWAEISRRHFVPEAPGKRFRKLEILCEQQNHRCCYCGVQMVYPMPPGGRSPNHASLEHLVPLSQGGRHGWDNLVAACGDCNSMRSSDDPFEFYEWRQTQIGRTQRQMRKTLGRYRKQKLKTTPKPPDPCWFCRLRARFYALSDMVKKKLVSIHLRQTG